jgi:MFS superfamily sulfate permease-like transporter
VLSLGFPANFISDPVLAGIEEGAMPALHRYVGNPVLSFLGRLFFRSDIRDFHCGLRAFRRDAILALKRAFPRFPAAVAVVAASIGATALFQLPRLGIKTIGSIPSGLPSLVTPQVNLLEALWPAALAIALMSFTETIASGRAFARPGQNRPEADRELLATAWHLGGLVGAMPSGGGTSQTLVQSGVPVPSWPGWWWASPRWPFSSSSRRRCP